MNQFDQEAESIEESFARGEISAKEKCRWLRELAYDYQAYAEEEAQRAYDDRMEEFLI